MDENFCDDVKARRFAQRYGVWIFASAILATLVGGVVYASQGTPDPTESALGTSHAVIVANSAVIVFREGLEAVLIFAAVTASMLGAQRGLRRPVAAGAGVAFAATVATWFLAQAILGQFSRYGDQLQAVTGLIAIAVLLVIMNWFFHKVYWTKWIGKRNAQRKRALAGGMIGGQVVGLVLLGFSTSTARASRSCSSCRRCSSRPERRRCSRVSRRSRRDRSRRRRDVLPAAEAAVQAHARRHRCDARRRARRDGGRRRRRCRTSAGSRTPIGVQFPDWWARWFGVVPTWETLGTQAFAAALVIGSYFAAEWLRVRRPAGAASAGRSPRSTADFLARPVSSGARQSLTF